jgi:hypothetical protein
MTKFVFPMQIAVIVLIPAFSGYAGRPTPLQIPTHRVSPLRDALRAEKNPIVGEEWA